MHSNTNVEAESFIQLRNISKHFSGHRALDSIDLTLLKGEVHCIAGTNGCGKSTLIKTISGVHQPEKDGEIEIDGTIYSRLTPDRSRSLGIQVIFQDLSLFPNLTVEENIAFDYNLGGYFTRFNKNDIRDKAKQVLSELSYNINPKALVETLPIAQRQQVAICRALVADARLVIMDEPTSSLTKAEVSHLLDTVRYLKTKSITVVFVSHRLEEVKEVSDRITVIRDGVKKGTWQASELSESMLTELMTGCSVKHARKERGDVSLNPVVLETKNLSRKGQYSNINLQLHEGEVLGVCGLLGSGRTELALSLFGITKPDSGEILISNQPVEFKTNLDAINLGIGYVSEDRLTLGAILEQSIADNMLVSNYGRLSKGNLLDESKCSESVNYWVERLGIKVTDTTDALTTLSGGNQQKVVLSKWLMTQPKVIILDSPTVGVDIGAKESIYTLIDEVSKQGISVLLITDEIGEAYYNCDRILHMKQGKITDQGINVSNISEQELVEVLHD